MPRTGTLYHFHDPMCSWCWGYRPVAMMLFANLPQGVARVDVLGGLAPDSDQPMPAAQREAIQGYWKRIESMLGTEFNHEFWRVNEPRRSTYPACRAVLAAQRQSRCEEMVHAIQRAYYLEARNPSDLDVLVALASELGLDAGEFRRDLTSGETEAELQRQIRFARDSGVTGFPSLILDDGRAMQPIVVDYHDHRSTLAKLAALLDAG